MSTLGFGTSSFCEGKSDIFWTTFICGRNGFFSVNKVNYFLRSISSYNDDQLSLSRCPTLRTLLGNLTWDLRDNVNAGSKSNFYNINFTKLIFGELKTQLLWHIIMNNFARKTRATCWSLHAWRHALRSAAKRPPKLRPSFPLVDRAKKA